MKKVMLFTIVAMLSFACDPCRKVECDNGGTCNDGECLCDAWYAGENCENYLLADHLGWYIGTITCGDQAFSTNYYVEDGDAPGQLVLNDGFVAIPMKFDAESTSEFTLSPTVDADGYTYSGYGSMSNEKLVVSITVQDQSSSATCIFIGT